MKYIGKNKVIAGPNDLISKTWPHLDEVVFGTSEDFTIGNFGACLLDSYFKKDTVPDPLIPENFIKVSSTKTGFILINETPNYPLFLAIKKKDNGHISAGFFGNRIDNEYCIENCNLSEINNWYVVKR